MTEQDIKRIEEYAKEYALTLVDEHEGTPQFICFKAGADYEHNYLTTQVVEAERKGWNEAIESVAKKVWNLRFDEVFIAEINDEIQKLKK